MVNQEAFPSSNTVAAVLVAAGSGSRMAEDGHPAKQFRLLAGKPVLTWSVDALLRCDKIGAVALVIQPGDRERIAELVPADSRVRLVDGGDTRSASVARGLEALATIAPAKVLIHDAARPGLSADLIDDLIAALDRADAAAPALVVNDALKKVDGETVSSVSREGLVRVQTPQAFRYAVIRNAYAAIKDSAVDDLALVEARGARIALIPGREALMKITHPEDLAVVSKLLTPAPAAMRIGNGFDVHGFEPGDAVILCGVRIPHTKKLEGHSDADAGWHALTDAILGAAALGDIGDHFPPSDPRWKGQDSRTFLVHAVKLAAEQGLKVVNADITLICEKPKIAPHREAMRVRTAEALGVDLSCVSIKATTTEKLGFLGREEGVAAQAVVLLAG